MGKRLSKQKKRGAKKASLSHDKKVPRIGATVTNGLEPKHRSNFAHTDQPKIGKKFRLNEIQVKIDCSVADTVGRWSWGDSRLWDEKEIQEFKKSIETQTWGEAFGTNIHHYQEVASFCKEAQVRWIQIGLEEYETAFRFRLAGKVRLWGYIDTAAYVFRAIWLDRKHQIYPVHLKHT